MTTMSLGNQPNDNLLTRLGLCHQSTTTAHYPSSSLIPRPAARILIREPSKALLTGVVKANGLPYLPLGAGFLNEARGLAEAGKREGEVLAREGVGVVLAHYELVVGVSSGG